MALLGAAESLAEVPGNTVGVKLEQGFFLPAREEIGEAHWRPGTRTEPG
jgi:hypothetical protein